MRFVFVSFFKFQCKFTKYKGFYIHTGEDLCHRVGKSLVLVIHATFLMHERSDLCNFFLIVFILKISLLCDTEFSLKTFRNFTDHVWFHIK